MLNTKFISNIATLSSKTPPSPLFKYLFLIFGIIIIILGIIGIFSPRFVWKLTKWQYMWQYRNNNLIEPSPVYLVFLRILSVFIVGVAIFLLHQFLKQYPISTF